MLQNNIKFKHIKVLTKRRDHLLKRIQDSDKDLTYDKQELSALNFALQVLHKMED